MGWEIEYQRDGKTLVHRNNNSEGDAKGWAESLAKHDGYAKLTHVADGPYDHSGKRTTVITHGEKKP